MKRLTYITAIAILSLGIFGCSQPQTNKANDTQRDTTPASKTESDNSSSNSTALKNQENTEEETQSPIKTTSANSTAIKSEGNLNQNTSSQSQANGKTNSPNDPESSTQAKINSTEQPTSGKLEVGTIKSIVHGDISCYVSLVDENGKTHEISASFEACEGKEEILNEKVKLSYEVANLNDCQSAEPCGKTRKETIISKMDVIEEKSGKSTQNKDTQTLSNGEWTITIDNTGSWNGVNGTGNLSYNGCDAKGNCLKLQGGTVTCRNGNCLMVWQNGDYSYIIEQPITEGGSSSSGATTLTVRKGSTIILNATGFKEK
ncbi:MAG TPA: hypothetical protein DEG17_12245 [Cyanobacteria bacterium UBA11149]|nr:hypothetical protein [Cyanobacteria bacterium UBA11367]HBE61147.1 hypothetical protein [Cyanobacteria bacterium UBA11366]HBK65916.1 hypothetical protein [Cyanobacteria bacterium UBA11166]HBR76707.1 hypothetical protein [Cyanobacteria bacterium UBA11159]HBS72364.1 hypothetical protein [Cyanobacteria bacterium UBA11153]HBW89617.1 hypothetical protein [Cyanobacteria bacterium UBA11149]HCA98247.1 hypothetical protein [Cyanobacteria bacterium UBA9226]